MTYIPKQEKVTKERLELKLEIGLIKKLESYCEFLESDRDYVVAKVLEVAFRKDRAFRSWTQSKNEDVRG